jgi:CDP-diglyceride synthetase
MSDASSPSDLSARVKTGFPLAGGIAFLLFSPTFVVGILVLAVVFIGAQELTSMLAKAEGDETLGLLPEWLLPGTAVLMGLGALAGQTGLHAALLISVVGWIFYELVFTPKSELTKLSALGFGLFGMVWVVWSVLHITLIKGLPEGTALRIFWWKAFWKNTAGAKYQSEKNVGRQLFRGCWRRTCRCGFWRTYDVNVLALRITAGHAVGGCRTTR